MWRSKSSARAAKQTVPIGIPTATPRFAEEAKHNRRGGICAFEVGEAEVSVRLGSPAMELVVVLLLVLVSVVKEVAGELGVAGPPTMKTGIGATGSGKVEVMAGEEVWELEEATVGLAFVGNVAAALSIASFRVKIRVSSAPE